MTHKSFFIYLAIMVLTTYLIRVIPFALVKNQIKNRYIRSFLHYIPYAVLTAMTVPAVFTATSYIISATVGFIVAVILALNKRSLTTVALLSCVAVFITELIIRYI